MDLNLPKAAAAAVDEAAKELPPLVSHAIAEAKSALEEALKNALDGLVVTITVSRK